MALSGQLDEMNLLEILQIVAFSRKSGTLVVESRESRGAVLFQDGRVHVAISIATEEPLRRLTTETFDASCVERLKEYTRIALQELVQMRDGFFEFEMSSTRPTVWRGLEVGSFLLTEGVDPEALLLELARELDESRREATELLELPPKEENPTVFPGSDLTVIVVDDEEQVSRAVGEAIANTGTTVDTAARADEALSLVKRLLAAGRPMALVADAGMPGLLGESYLGGLDLAEAVREIDPSVPILLMAESLTNKARSRARRLGVRRVAFKPALTKLDPDEYDADLQSFGENIVAQLVELVRSRDEPSTVGPEPPINLEAIFGFLRQLTAQLDNPGNAVARMVLRVASKFAERVLIFLVRESRAHGLAGVQLGRADRQVTEELRRVSVGLQDVKPFAEVVYTRRTTKSVHELDLVPSEIARGRATEFALLPLVSSHEVVAVIYLDNPGSGRRLTSLAGLEMFLAQAGMAMDNASLQKKLRATSTPFSIDNQGPLTQELSRVTPSSK